MGKVKLEWQIIKFAIGLDGTTILVMTLLAMLFILKMVVKWGEKAEMISVQDIKEVLGSDIAKK